MIPAPSLSLLRILLCCSVAVLGAGCFGPAGQSPRGKFNAAFISYRAPAGNPGQLKLAVKDLIDMKGEVTSAGSEYLAKHSPPAKADAACLRLARARKDVTIVGKTNLTELAVGVSGVNQYFGTPRNPLSHRRRLIPGGSSSGSAVAVGLGLADVAFGTDTAGSIRTPAACCGVAGLKTTFGLISLKGVYPIAPNQLDTVGPMARDIHGLVQGMELLQPGFPAQHATAAPWRTRKVRVGRLYLPGTDPKIDQAVDAALTAAHLEIVPLSDGFRKEWEQAQKDASTVAAVNAWIYDRRYTGQTQVQIITRAVVALGTFQYRLGYREALSRRLTWQAEMQRLLRQVDFIALPTLRGLPPVVPWILRGNPAFELQVLGFQNTQAVNLAGNPALAMPIPLADRRLRVTSLQLIGPKRSEAALLQVGQRVETAVGKPNPAVH